MLTLIRSTSIRRLAALEAPSGITALVVAELFYKFHSFTLECLAFLATWAIIDALVAGLLRATSTLRAGKATLGHNSNSVGE